MRKLATAAFSFCAAIFISQYVLAPTPEVGLAAVCGILGFFMLLMRCAARKRVVLILFSAALGFLWNWGYETVFVAPAQQMDGISKAVCAVVNDFPTETPYGYSLDLKVDTGEKPYIRTLAYFSDEAACRLKPGDEITFSGEFSLSDSIRGEDTYTFVSKGFLLFARNTSGLKINSSPGFRIKYMHRWLTKEIDKKIAEILPKDEAGFMQALITGNKVLISDDTELVAALKRTSVYHIIVVSGMHVSVLAGFVMLLCGKKRRSFFIIIPVIILFAGISGFTPSVVRAVIMQLFLLLAPLVNRENDSITSLSAAMAVILIFNPFAATGAGFQLSFAATLGIILFSPKLYVLFDRYEGKKQRSKMFSFFKNFIAGSLSSTFAASILTMPLMAIYFGYVSIIAPVANLMILWAVTPAFCMGISAVALGFVFAPAGNAVAWAAAWLIMYIIWLAKTASDTFFAAVYLDNILLLAWFIFAYSVIVLFLVFKAKPRQILVPACVSVVLLCSVLILNSWTRSSKTGSIGFSTAVLDVGQGQCIVFSGGGYTAVVDCGGTSGKNAGEIVTRYLYNIGIERVDLLVLTHCHADHVNGVAGLMAYADVAAVALPENVYDEYSLEDDIIELADAEKSDIMYISEDTYVVMGDIALTLFAPLGSVSENERGLCVLASLGDYDVLVTGDIDSASEKILIEHTDLPDIECLVVGHHGSKYSTCDRLLDAATPELALISVGNNRYGHPAEETLRRLYNASITVYRTDEYGNIVVTPSGEK